MTEMARVIEWLPRIDTARRIGARFRRAHLKGQIVLTGNEERDCVDCLMTPFLAPEMRKRSGRLWMKRGQELIGKTKDEDKVYKDDRKKDLDAALNALALAKGESFNGIG